MFVLNIIDNSICGTNCQYYSNTLNAMEKMHLDSVTFTMNCTHHTGFCVLSSQRLE